MHAHTLAGDHRPALALVSPAPRHVVLHGNRLRLFGGAALETSSGPVVGRASQRHRIALLALLATTRRACRGRDQLVALLWPDVDAERGRRLLSDSIYRINSALGGDAIAGAGESIHLDRSRLSSDVADLEHAVDAGRWERVVAHYAGPFLDGFYLPGSPEFDHWMDGERAQYTRAMLRALESLALAARDDGRVAAAADWWQQLALHAPDDSRIAMELMRSLETAGHRAAALRHARKHAAYLRDILGVEPDSSLHALAERIASHMPLAIHSGVDNARNAPMTERANAPKNEGSPAPKHQFTDGLYGWITHTDLASNDPVATKTWCAKVLGWTFKPPFAGPAGDVHLFAYSDKGGGAVRAVSPPEIPGSIPYVHVADARALFDAALREGAEEMLPPTRVMEGVTIAIVRAPGGVPIGLSGP